MMPTTRIRILLNLETKEQGREYEFPFVRVELEKDGSALTPKQEAEPFHRIQPTTLNEQD